MIKLVLPLFLLLAAAAATGSAAPPSMALPNCKSKCGNVHIPYPFGIGRKCSYSPWFEITCNTTVPSTPSKPFLRKFNLELLGGLNITNGFKTFTLSIPIGATNSKCPQAGVEDYTSNISFNGSPFRISPDLNIFTVVGCDNALLSYGETIMAGCTSECADTDTNFTSNSSSRCYGIDCCQTSIPDGIDKYSIRISGEARNCTKAFLSLNDWYTRNLSNAIYETDHAPVAIAWSPVDGYEIGGDSRDPVYNCFAPKRTNENPCTCGWAYEGNPYIRNGCKVAQACAKCEKECSRRGGGQLYCKHSHKTEIILGAGIGGGLLIILSSVFCFWLHKLIKKKKRIRLKKKFFKRNGGLLLEQQISSDETKADKTMIFSSEVLEKATDNFNASRILGEGGQGTVYKGMLTDGRIVAIKKSKVIDESQLEVFTNEVVILSQLNHRNIVKLLGCCLETEVPLLVYEFISNGNLFELIHHPDEDFSFSWKMRLQIATEAAGALAYLHSASSIPIYHRDIKSTNILLDEKFRAKIADFGTSRFIAIEQTHLTTVVQGTFGYLDPEYFQSSMFTDKSDVYSYGVVLIELLTGQKAISPITSAEDDDRSLATRFIMCMKEKRLFEILDSRVKEEARQEDVVAIANIAKRCVNLNSKKRPTMTEVMRELEGIRMSHLPKPPAGDTTQDHFEDEDFMEMMGPIDSTASSIQSGVVRRGFSSTMI